MSQSALELYQSVVLEHNRAPRGHGDLPGATHVAEGFNPICGDRVKVQVIVTDNQVNDIKFTAQCCALCRASASVMASVLPGKASNEIRVWIGQFEESLHGGAYTGGSLAETDARAFFAMNQFPARVKCVLLPWRTLFSALSDQHTVSTESKE